MNISKINYTYGMTFTGSNEGTNNQNPITGNSLPASEGDSVCIKSNGKTHESGRQSGVDRFINKCARVLTHLGPAAKEKDVDKLEQKAEDKGMEDPNLFFERFSIGNSRCDAVDVKTRLDALNSLLDDDMMSNNKSVQEQFNGIAITLKTEFLDGNSVDNLYLFLDTIESDEFEDVRGNENIQNHMGEFIIKAICDMPKTCEFLEGIKDGNISPDEETINEFLTAVDSKNSNQDT